MPTRDITLNASELQRIRQWVDREWYDLDQQRMHQRPDSPQEAAILADQIELQALREKLIKR